MQLPISAKHAVEISKVLAFFAGEKHEEDCLKLLSYRVFEGDEEILERWLEVHEKRAFFVAENPRRFSLKLAEYRSIQTMETGENMLEHRRQNNT